MYHFEKNSKIFSQERPREKVWGPRENVSPGPAVALDGPVSHCSHCCDAIVSNATCNGAIGDLSPSWTPIFQRQSSEDATALEAPNVNKTV